MRPGQIVIIDQMRFKALAHGVFAGPLHTILQVVERILAPNASIGFPGDQCTVERQIAWDIGLSQQSIREDVVVLPPLQALIRGRFVVGEVDCTKVGRHRHDGSRLDTSPLRPTCTHQLVECRQRMLSAIQNRHRCKIAIREVLLLQEQLQRLEVGKGPRCS
ncbi:hypothetical protein D9M68_828500 [compost metagenome]